MSVTSLASAKKLLNLDPRSIMTAKLLRQAYLKAAMKCHPDIHKDKDIGAFHEITEAYELLQSGINPLDDLEISIQDDTNFRNACQEWLGIPAEVVEECKKCPMFREWLNGKTDASFRWNLFLSLHGGIAPMLRQTTMLLDGQRHTSLGPARRKKK
jgi:DnaJ domain